MIPSKAGSTLSGIVQWNVSAHLHGLLMPSFSTVPRARNFTLHIQGCVGVLPSGYWVLT